jgi:signal transduction histidine kinase
MIVDKIFQPFFAIKPTGQRTGLGLMSFIIIKAYGGEMTVDSMVGEGSSFVITIPIQF